MIGTLSGCTYKDTMDIKQYKVYITDAPFGRYWVHDTGEIGGGFLYFHGYYTSDLRESYTVKYFFGDELKTMIVSSTDDTFHVHLTNDSNNMTLQITKDYRHSDSTGSSRMVDQRTDLFIPRPELCRISNETVTP